MNTGIPLEYFLILATIMFFTGVYGFLTRGIQNRSQAWTRS